jgi:pimeloyl-ACP methyl ester carboxylesterase
VPLLAAQGLAVATPDLYSQSAPWQPDVVQNEVDRLRESGPVIVCGHSFGGYAITAIDPDTVDHVVYLAALMPGRERWYADTPVSLDFFEMVDMADGAMRFKTERARELLYADCDDRDVAWAIERLVAHPLAGTPETIDRPAWAEVPTTYVCCDEDRTLTADYMKAAIDVVGNGVHWPTSHSPMISQPHRVADLLVDLAARLPDR